MVYEMYAKRKIIILDKGVFCVSMLHYNAVKAFLFLIVDDTNIKQSFNVIVNNITFPLTHLKSINPRIYPYQRDRYMAYS